MKRELNLIITTLNGYVIDRKNIIKNTTDMTVDDILNELFEKRVEFYGEKIIYTESLMGSYDDLERFVKENRTVTIAYHTGGNTVPKKSLTRS